MDETVNETLNPSLKRPNWEQKTLSDLKKKRQKLAEESSIIDISELKCCKGKRCFTKVKVSYFKAQRKRMLQMSQEQRKICLTGMLRLVKVDEKVIKRFYFDGRPVCSTFLDIGFGISRFLQCAVKETPRSGGSKSIFRMPGLGAKQMGKEFINAYLVNLAESTANRMPDSGELHLPYFEKKQVYQMFKTHWNEHDGMGNIILAPTYAYFIKVWGSNCRNIKCRRVHRFSKCDICEKLRQELAEAGMDRTRSDELRKMQKNHHRFVEMERMQYYKNREAARISPHKFASIIIDGASQSCFELPHWPYETKGTQRGHKIRVHVTGILEHACPNKLMLLTITEEHKTGSNHVIEALHRWLCRKAMEGKLPDVLFIQVDNCSRENKNRYFMSYVECLVSLEVFAEIHVSFLPVGHTHEDIDQCFSCLSKRLRTNSAITLQDLHHELTQAYTPRPFVAHMIRVINLSTLFENSKCLQKVPSFSHFRYFRFSRASGETRSQYERHPTTASVKETCQGEWNPLHPGRSGGFLKFTPNLFSAPPTETSPPENILEVSRGIAAAESRIADRKKVEDLEMLRDTIYKPRKDRAHWNRFLSPESGNWNVPNLMGYNVVSETNVDDENEVVVNYCYVENDLIAVRASGRNCPFWLAHIRRVVTNCEGDISRLHVAWLEAHGNTKDPFMSKYRTALVGKKNEWVSEISPNSVLARLTELKRDKRLTVDDSKRIRESLSVFA